jgi:hypothetical protein
LAFGHLAEKLWSSATNTSVCVAELLSFCDKIELDGFGKSAGTLADCPSRITVMIRIFLA